MRRACCLRARIFLSTLALFTAASAVHAGQVFTTIAANPLNNLTFAPSINNSGVVAYMDSALVPSGVVYSIRTSDNSQTLPSSVPTVYTSLASGPTINDSGVLAFQANINNSTRGIFTSTHNNPTAAVTSSSATGGIANFGTSGGLLPALNNNGTVAMFATRNGLSSAQGAQVIVTATPPAAASYAVTSSTASNGFFTLGNPVLNNAGTLAFSGTTGDQSTTGIFEMSGSTTSMLVTNQGANGFVNLGSLIGMNQSGSVVFTGHSTHDSAWGVYVVNSSGQVTNAVNFTTASGISANKASGVAINDLGQIAFTAALANGSGTGLFVSNGSGGFTKIAQTGDVINGTTISSVVMSNFALNNSGQVTFLANSNRIIRLDPSGSTTANPVLPTSQTGSTFNFDPFALPTSTIGLGRSAPVFFDPIYAVGYEYRVTGGELIKSVLLPGGLGVSRYELDLWNGSAYDFSGYIDSGSTFTFSSPTDRFEIKGIPVSAQLDPSNGNAFVTGLTFAGTGAAVVSMTPLTSVVPEPATIASGLAGLAFGLAILRRDARRSAG